MFQNFPFCSFMQESEISLKDTSIPLFTKILLVVTKIRKHYKCRLIGERTKKLCGNIVELLASIKQRNTTVHLRTSW